MKLSSLRYNVVLLLCIGLFALPGCKKKTTIELVRDGLKHPDWRVRVQAANAAARLGPKAEPVRALLLSTLNDRNGRARQSAANALYFQGDVVLPALIKSLAHPSNRVRQVVSQTVSRFGKKATPALIKALSAPKAETRAAALSALGRIGMQGSEAVPSVAKLLQDKNWEVRANAVQALSNLGRKQPKVVIASLLQALKDKDWRVQASAAFGLGTFAKDGADEHIGALLPLLKHPNVNVRRTALDSLGRIGTLNDEVQTAMLGATKDKKWLVRQAALRNLRALRANNSVVAAALLQKLNDRHWMVRKEAVETLAVMGKQAKIAMPIMLQVLPRDRVWQVKAALLTALLRIDRDSPKVLEALKTYALDKDPRIASAAMKSMSRGKFGKAAKDTLLKASASKNWQVRESAVTALGSLKLADPAIIKRLQEALKDKRSVVRSSATYALGTIGPAAKSVLPDIIALLKDKKVDEVGIAFAMAQMGNTKKALPILYKALRSRYRVTRLNAMGTLGRFGAKAAPAVPTLIQIVRRSGPDRMQQIGASTALMRIGPSAVKPLLNAMKRYPDLRSWVPEIIGRMRQNAAAAAPVLATFLDTKYDWRVRGNVAGALGVIKGDPKVTVAALQKAVVDPDWRVRINAATALGRAAQNTPALRDFLTKRLTAEKDAWVKRELRKSLKLLSQPAPAAPATRRAAPQPPATR